MRLLLRRILTPILSDTNRKKLKKWEFKARKYFISKLPKLGEKDFRKLLIVDFGVEDGDHLFVHASLSLINTDLTPKRMLAILQNIIGENGSVTVPCYPGMSSKKFMETKKKFHIKSSPSGMGEFSEYVRKHPDSTRSFHPTKSLASIGLPKNVLDGHNDSQYPFGEGSPYQKILKYNPKVLGVGVPMSYLSFVHIGEDMNYERYPLLVNEAVKLSKICVDEEGLEYAVSTFVHDMRIVAKANPKKYVTQNMAAQYWKIRNWYLSPFFMVDGKALTESISENIDNNITVYN